MELLLSLAVFSIMIALGISLMHRREHHKQERGLLQRIAQPQIKQELEDTGITRDPDRPEGFLETFLPGARLLGWVQLRMTQAAIFSVSAADILTLTLGLTAVGGFAGWLWNGRSFAAALFVALGLGATPMLYVLWRRRQRLRAFDMQLPEILDMLKASLEAGHTLQRALQVGIDEFAEPAASELRVVMEQNSLGVPLERSLELMQERLPDENLRFLVTAVKIQVQAGTSLARIIGELARTVRDRHRMEMKVRVLTAQPRISGIAAGLMPVLVMFGMYFINPDHVHMLLFDPVGVMITKIAAALEITAFVVIYRMVRLDY
jgi:tight adherence protein B